MGRRLTSSSLIFLPEIRFVELSLTKCIFCCNILMKLKKTHTLFNFDQNQDYDFTSNSILQLCVHRRDPRTDIQIGI